MTPQEIFTKAYTEIVKQGRPSVDSNGVCVYYGGPGIGCAVGKLVSEESAKRFDECECVVRALIKQCDDVPDWFKDNADLLDSIQRAHDCNVVYKGEEFLCGYELTMRRIASSYGLEVPQ